MFDIHIIIIIIIISSSSSHRGAPRGGRDWGWARAARGRACWGGGGAAASYYYYYHYECIFLDYVELRSSIYRLFNTVNFYAVVSTIKICRRRRSLQRRSPSGAAPRETAEERRAELARGPGFGKGNHPTYRLCAIRMIAIITIVQISIMMIMIANNNTNTASVQLQPVPRARSPQPRSRLSSGVHKRGCSKGGFTNLCVIIMSLLFPNPLH